MKIIKKLSEWANKHEWLIAFLLMVIILRIPSLFTPHYYGDEEIYFVMGRAWREGIPLYEAMFDHKPPLIYIIAGITESIFWFRSALLITMLVHTYIFYEISHLLFGKSKQLLPKLATGIFVILTSLPLLEGNIANAELFMMLPLSLSMLILLKTDFSKSVKAAKMIMLSGLVAGVGWLYKIPVAFDAAAVGLYFFVYKKETWKEALKSFLSWPLWLYALSFALPLMLSFGYYFMKGHGASYLDTVLTMNLGYVSSWTTSTYSFNPFRSGLFVRGIILIIFAILLFFMRKRLQKELVLVLLWLAFSFFGSLLSGRPYPHYLLQPVVPFSLLVPYFFVADNIASWAMIGYLLIWGTVTAKQIKFWGYPTWSFYRNYAQYAMGKISKDDYLNTFDGVRRNYALAKYIGERINDGEEIYVWGSDPTIYNLLGRNPSGGKYIVSFHVADLKKFDYVISKLNESNPKFVVIMKEAPIFTQLENKLDTEYIRVAVIEEALVYMKLEIK